MSCGKDAAPVRGYARIARLIAEGEHVMQDFKYAITDARKIARTISAFANTMGGRLLIGVRDNGSIAGLRHADEDMYLVEMAAGRYCRPAQTVSFTTWRADRSGALVLEAVIARAPGRGVQSQDNEGHWHAYCRVVDENILASPLHVASWALSRDASELSAPFSSVDYEVIRVIEADPEQCTTVETIARAARVSAATAREVLVRMLSAGVMRLWWSGTRWEIRMQDPEDPE